MLKYVVLVPAFNELENLKKIIKFKYNYLILDDCSTDGTTEFLKKNKIKYIRNNKNLGYEKNIKKGFQYLKFKKYKGNVITVDGDYQHPINRIKPIYKFFLKKNLDLLICNRNKKNRFLESVIGYLCYKLFNIKDPLSGMKIYKNNVINKNFNNIYNDTYFTGLVFLAIKKKMKIANYEIKVKKSYKSKIGYSIKVYIKLIKIFFYFLILKIELR